MPSKIEWTDETWNPITGCTKISEGCQNCYAERMSRRLAHNPAVDNFHRYKGFVPHFWPERVNEPLKWKKPRRIFVCSMGDLFHELIRDDQINQIFSTMISMDRHKFIVLTKRPERMKKYILGSIPYIKDAGKPKSDIFDHIWFGITAESQKRANERIPILIDIPVKNRFVSIEPMLGSIDLNYHWLGLCEKDAPCGFHGYISWVICGGETGPGARQMEPNWARWIKDQCAIANVPFFMKQMAKKEPIPKDLMIRHLPNETID